MNIVASNRPFKDSVASNPKELAEYLKNHDVKRIYFPFWSWKVPKELLLKYECIGFHCAPLPKGRGGSPIQNMIRLGHTQTPVYMFKMTEELDSGYILGNSEVSLSGSLSDIICRLVSLICSMIYDYESGLSTFTGTGYSYDNVPDTFIRVTDNKLPEISTLEKIYDEIRMRDEVNHPKAYIWLGKHRIDFSDAKLEDGKITVRGEIYEP